jgi:hypothetical protein
MRGVALTDRKAWLDARDPEAKPGDRREEEVWEETERRMRERKRRENRVKWGLYHKSQAERLRHAVEPLINRHQELAERLLE